MPPLTSRGEIGKSAHPWHRSLLVSVRWRDLQSRGPARSASCRDAAHRFIPFAIARAMPPPSLRAPAGPGSIGIASQPQHRRSPGRELRRPGRRLGKDARQLALQGLRPGHAGRRSSPRSTTRSMVTSMRAHTHPRISAVGERALDLDRPPAARPGARAPCSTGAPASAARNAAFSAMLRMLPPVMLSCARRSGSQILRSASAPETRAPRSLRAAPRRETENRP